MNMSFLLNSFNMVVIIAATEYIGVLCRVYDSVLWLLVQVGGIFQEVEG